MQVLIQAERTLNIEDLTALGDCLVTTGATVQAHAENTYAIGFLQIMMGNGKVGFQDAGVGTSHKEKKKPGSMRHNGYSRAPTRL